MDVSVPRFLGQLYSTTWSFDQLKIRGTETRLDSLSSTFVRHEMMNRSYGYGPVLRRISILGKTH